ncbi:MAG: hypothetical protein SOZ62_03960 [Eubacteriales bacterium]|nr:hypothetical protein [Eubacteriales bacterium]
MLEIKPIQSKEIQKELAENSGTEFIPDAFAYSAYEGDKFLGMSQFTINEGYAYIINISYADGTQDEEAMFIMGRAVLNFLDLCNVSVCKISDTAATETLIRKIGFKKGDDGHFLPLTITGMFDAKCHPNK